MRLRELALALALLGLVCLPAPLYLGWAAEATAPPQKTSQVYAAQPLDPSDPTDREVIVDRHATAVALSTHQVSERYSAGEYRAPNVTRRALDAAMRTGSATVDDPDARAGLRRIARNYTFVYDAYDDAGYHRLRASEDGSTVRARNVSADRVANATVERAAVRYDDLSPGERRTVDRVLANSSEDDFGYRPRVDDPFVDRLPALVHRDDTLYSVHVVGHVDDFGPGFGAFVIGLGVAAVGVVLVVAAGVIALLARQREGGR